MSSTEVAARCAAAAVSAMSAVATRPLASLRFQGCTRAASAAAAGTVLQQFKRLKSRSPLGTSAAHVGRLHLAMQRPSSAAPRVAVGSGAAGAAALSSPLLGDTTVFGSDDP